MRQPRNPCPPTTSNGAQQCWWGLCLPGVRQRWGWPLGSHLLPDNCGKGLISCLPLDRCVKHAHLFMRLNSPAACIACHESWLVACTATGTDAASVTGASRGSERIMLWPWAARILGGMCCSSSTNRCCMHRTHGIAGVQSVGPWDCRSAAGSADRTTAATVLVGGMCCSFSTKCCCSHKTHRIA